MHGETELWKRLLELMQKVREEQKVVSDCRDAVNVAFLKKHDTHVRDN